MTYDEWLRYREEWFRDNPIRPQHLRLDVELTFPRDRLRDVPIEFNPHHHGHEAFHLFYVCADWTIRTPVVRINPSPHDAPTWRMIVESGHHDGRPRLRLMSTSCAIVHESWAARKNWNDFAYYVGMYWRITWNEFFGEWPGGRMWGLPFQDRRHYDVEDLDESDHSLS